ncbi:MAG: HAMP domain-containing sensor histidine kinase [Candidatus Paceibacterota bacterium]
MSKGIRSDKDELISARKELAFQMKEKGKRAAELAIADIELAFQNQIKERRAAELIIANKELVFQNIEKEKRAAELSIANIELAYQNDEKEKRAEELTVANKELAYQYQVKEKRAAELVIANKELAFQNKEKEKRAAELSIANIELAYQNDEKEKRAAELFIANKELVFQTGEKEKRAAELAVADIEQRRNDSFMSMASHELKTPVTTIKTLVQILQHQYGRSEDSALVEYLYTIGQQIDQLTKLVVDLLDVSKIKAEKFMIEDKTFDFDALARETVKSCQLLSPQHAISIAGNTKAQVRGDRDSISRVFINLITNAIKYSPKADTINIVLSHRKKTLRVGIQDLGIGIAKSDQEKIFERFYQVGNDSGQSFAGLGIGLYITAAIVAQHSGRIWVESTGRRGSIFFFELPIHAVQVKDVYAVS